MKGDFMDILVMKIRLRAVWVHSLKEKRMVVKSIVHKLQNKFNISVAEVEDQDIHQSIVIGISAVCGSAAQCDSTMENILSFVEENTEAEMVHIEHEIINI